MPRRSIAIASLLIGMPVAHAAPCQAEQSRHDRLAVRCTWPAGNAPQALRFDARFAGSHDDTTATLDASLDGAPLACQAGSKTTIEGQDEGDVTLQCRLSLPQPISAASVLRFELAWHHARYQGFELVGD